MDLIKEAIRKAKLAQGVDASIRPGQPQARGGGLGAAADRGWTPVEVSLDPAHLAANRIVSHAMTDPSHVAFNLLRTKVYKALKDSRWHTLAVTSPTAGCGKTMVAVNLAYSLARQPSCRTVLIDLDLSRSGVSKTVGVSTTGSIGHFLRGEALFEDCFVRVTSNLILGLNPHHLRNSSELVHEDRIKALLARVRETLAPDVIVFDLPPILVTDEAIAVLPSVDASLLVVAEGTTTVPQIQECERHMANRAGFLGLVLNKSREVRQAYYY